MRPTSTYDINQVNILPGRKRLLEAHKKLGSWKKVADEIGMNFRYVWDFAVKGKLPRNPEKRKKLLGRKTINEHLAQDKISDMPTSLLAWAFENREEWK